MIGTVIAVLSAFVLLLGLVWLGGYPKRTGAALYPKE